MSITIYRAGDLYNRPALPDRSGKRGRPATRGLFNVGRTTFYDVIEPRLERVRLTQHAVGYTGRSVQREIKASIAAAEAEDDAK